MRLSLAFVPLVLLGGVALLAAPAIAPKKGADTPKKAVDVAPASEDWAVFDKPGKFITALCATDDTLWIGTEDNSLWRLDLKADPAKDEAWQHFGPKDTATDHVYGLAVDAAGRLWCGTLNQGVSVYNGRDWRNYGVLDGCSGERVFAIAADRAPSRGSVWIGTDNGLVCWTPSPDPAPVAPPPSAVSVGVALSGRPAVAMPWPSPWPFVGACSAFDPPPATPLAPGRWRTFTQADGLPSQQIYAVAVTSFGRVWVGTECDGLAWADAPYDKWTSIRADAEKSGDAGEASGCGGGTAPGLPSNLTNALAVFKDGTTVVSTDYGLGIRKAGDLKWTSWQGLSKEPYENYSRGLAVDSAGGLWIATRQKGLARFDPKAGTLRTWSHAANGPSLPDDYVFDVAVGPKGDVWAGTYGGGLARLRPSAISSSKMPVAAVVSPSNPESEIRNPHSPLPAPLGVPTLDELNAMLADLAKVPFVPPEKQPAVVRLDDDWLTKGDCLGRYGRYWGCWCAICPREDYTWGVGPEPVRYYACIGPNCEKFDSIRYWVHWHYTKVQDSLEMPPVFASSRVMKGLTTPDFYRRQAEWDDHGEAYAMSRNGPGLFCVLRIPAGVYYLSLYDFNKDGHDGNNRWRDYICSMRTHQRARSLDDLSDFEKEPELSRGRIRDFWGGVYKRFLVQGPSEVVFRESRNHSHNTILAGIFVDPVEEYPLPYTLTLQRWREANAEREKERNVLRTEGAEGSPGDRFHVGRKESEAADRLFNELERTRLVNSVWWSTSSRPFYVAVLKWTLSERAGSVAGRSEQDSHKRLATTYCELGLYSKWETEQAGLGLVTSRQVEKAIRWDGKGNFGGKGNAVITKYAQDHGLIPSRMHDCIEAARGGEEVNRLMP